MYLLSLQAKLWHPPPDHARMALTTNHLHGQRLVITGASRGLGRALPKRVYVVEAHVFGLPAVRSESAILVGWAGLLGTGGAIRRALPLLGSGFFVLYGDSYLRSEYQRIAGFFLQTEALGLMTVFQNHNKRDVGNVEFEQGRIIAYDKKVRTVRMSYIDYGLGIFRAAAFEGVPDNQALDLSDVYRWLLQDGRLASWEVQERFYEIGSEAGMRELSEVLS